ncbi:MAG: DUF11 domain-containing protein, partial [Candidatus Hydrogenedens sp.]|nr:DUF11 domain-containing protein [Candidatus Hydrogenedens sp.]
MSTVSTFKKFPKSNTSAALSLLFVGMLLLPLALQAQPTEIVFSSPGSNTFQVPAGITEITVEVWGAGGRGAFRTTGNNLPLAGGGGGAYARSVLTVTPGQSFPLYVGAGSFSPDPGEDSWFGSDTTVLAKGGESSAQNSNVPGAGGAGALSVGDQTYSGGYGAQGAGGLFGGGGGSSAGSNAAGAYADDTSLIRQGAAAPAKGGAGGAGAEDGVAGEAGALPGGGGGGAYRAGNSTTQNPGRGASGQVVVTYNCVVEKPVFAAGSVSSRCSGAESIIYEATAAGAASITYTLDAASLAGGNTIDAVTGELTFDANWAGLTVITATAATGECFLTEEFTVNTLASVGIPVFSSSAITQRCATAESIVFSATADDASSIEYSLDAASLAAGNTIDELTGEVTFDASWHGTTTITAIAHGCNTSIPVTHVVVTGVIFANNDLLQVLQGNPITFNVLDNDQCNYDPTTVSIISNPVGGFVQDGGNGEMTYVSFGEFHGTDQFRYRVCTPGGVECVQATVYIEVLEAIDDPCFIANKESTFYLPYPENVSQLRQSLLSAGSVEMNSGNNGGTNARSVISILVPYPGTRIVYDHWEDGYESDSDFPAQSSTQVWGDGDPSNGVAPGYPNDIIPAGGYIILDNTFSWNRPDTEIRYDGKDKITASSNVVVSKVSGDSNRFSVQNVKTNVSDASTAGMFFVLPFGEDMATSAVTVFRYTGLFVRAYEDNTEIALDLDGDGVDDKFSPTLMEGEVWFYNGYTSQTNRGYNPDDVNKAGDIQAGARVSATKPVSVDMVFGGIDSYGTRNLAILPSNYYGHTYYSPVYSTNTSAPALAYFVNPNEDPITITWTRRGDNLGDPMESGIITVPPDNGYASFNMDKAKATKFQSTGGEYYTAVAIMDADASGSTYDWAFTMIPERKLTPMAAVAWAPGSDGGTGGNANSDGSRNYAPVWVTVSQPATIYVKYDGDITTGPNQSPCGAYYDVSYSLNALEARLIYGPASDNSGMAVFNCNNVPLIAVWGQRTFAHSQDGVNYVIPPTSSPAQDVGYTMEPLCLGHLIFATDDYEVTAIETPVTVDVLANDGAYLCDIDTDSVTVVADPANGSVVVNSDGTITYTPNFGFTGLDSFDYTICAIEPVSVCDTGTVYINIPCNLTPGYNTIGAHAFLDYNINGFSDSEDIAVEGIEMELYEDVNGDGILDSGDILLHTGLTDATGRALFILEQDFSYRDEFQTANDPNGDDGTLSWSTPWSKQDSSPDFNAGSIRIITNGLQVRGTGTNAGSWVERTFDLSEAHIAELSFDWLKTTFNSSSNDWVEIMISDSPSGPFTALKHYSGTAAGGGSDSFDITGFKSATTTIRFNGSPHSGFSNSERVTFSNVEVRYYQEVHYLARIADPIVDDFMLTSVTEYFPISFVGINNSSCTSIFGIAKADLSVQKTVDDPNPLVGTESVFTITVTNNGLTDADNVELADILPIGLDYVSHSGIGTYNHLSGLWLVGRVDRNTSASLEIRATTNLIALTGVINKAEIINSSVPDPDGTNDEDDVHVLARSRVVAVDDLYGPINGYAGDPNAGNALANDSYNFGPATFVNVTMTQVTPATPLVPGAPVPELDPNTAVVSIPPETPAGTYQIPYTICDNLDLTNCDSAVVTVIVAAAPIHAEDDLYGPFIGRDGTPFAGNALSNDTLNGAPVDINEIILTEVAPATPVRPGEPVPEMDPITGDVSVPPGTPSAVYEIKYQICEKLNPTNCDTATIFIDVEVSIIEANDDNYGPVNGTHGTPNVGNALDNDLLDGSLVDINDINVSVVNGATPVTPGDPVPVLNTTTGQVSVPPGTPHGTYTIDYSICEKLNPDNCDDATITVEVYLASLEVEKVADVTELPVAGTTITYTITVTNTGTVTLTDVEIKDPLTGLEEGPMTLTVGEVKTYTDTYVVLQSDVDTGTLANTATATAKDPDGNPVDDDDTETLTVTKAPAIEVTKIADHPTLPVAGTTINYTITVTNTGNVTLSDVMVNDALTGLADGPLTLLPGEDKVYNETYVVLQSDVDNGTLANTATATGKDPDGGDVDDDDDVTLTVTKAPAIEVTKVADVTALPVAGTTINYTITVTNTGNVTLSDVMVNDPLTGLSDGPLTLLPGEDKVYNETYVVLQSDVDNGTLANKATATGKDPDGGDVDDDDDVTLTVTKAPAIEVTKVADVTELPVAGTTINYTITVTNTGNVTLSDVMVNDALTGLADGPLTLLPGEDKVYNETYVVLQSDVDTGTLANTATATAKDPDGGDVDDDDTVTLTGTKTPGIEVTKVADVTALPVAGTTINYTITVTNTGNVTLSDVMVNDPLTGLADGPLTLLPGEDKVYNETYVVLQSDVDNGTLANTATATGKDPDGGDVD